MCAPAAAAAAAGVCLTFSLFVRVSLTLSPLTHLTAYICLPVFAYTPVFFCLFFFSFPQILAQIKSMN